MEETILRSDVFKALISGEPFDMSWVMCDRRRGTGGELISVEGWMILSDEAEVEPGNVTRETTDVSRDPDHARNGTVNVFNPANSGVHPYKVHIDLIQTFNGKRVIN